MRLSSPAMTDALVRGASEAGADVARLGLVGTEMVYFAVGELGLDGGIAVTASHNPKEYTGMKIVRRGALPVGGESGLPDVRDRAMSLPDRSGGQARGPVEKSHGAGDTARGQAPRPVRRGLVSEVDIWPAYVERVLSFVDLEALRPLRVVVDAANGTAGVMLPPVLERLPMVEAQRYFLEPD